MIVEKVKRGNLVGKIFSTYAGYHYKVYVGKTSVAQSYVYLADYNLCKDRMLADMKSLDLGGRFK